ncbi:MAG: hypothetical protein WD757_02690 [Actinomycetota bacterium]
MVTRKARSVIVGTLTAALVIGGLVALRVTWNNPDRSSQGNRAHGRIVFAANVADRWRLFTMNSDGTERREPIGGAGGYSSDWSPDGSHIVYETVGGELWTMNADGSNKHQIVRGNEPLWSPDGNRIVFERMCRPTRVVWFDKGVAGSASCVFIVNSDGKDSHELLLSKNLSDSPISWFPDGERILLSRASRLGTSLWEVNADGTQPRRLIPWKEPGEAGEFSLSPKGSLLAFSKGEDIWTMSLDGGNEVQLTSGPGYSSNPAWSPDGARIVFSRGGDIWVMDASGANERAVTSSGYRPEELAPVWGVAPT